LPKLFRSAFSWCSDWIVEHWPTLFAALFGGGGMTYLSIITGWIEPWGPVGWGAIGLSSFLISLIAIAIVYYIFAVAKQRSVQSDYVRRQLDAGRINVLSQVYQRERISVSQFFHPFFRKLKQVRFENCDLMGPCNIIVHGSFIDNCEFIDCEIIIARPDRPIKSAVIFEGCHFVNTRVFLVTLILPFTEYNRLSEKMKGITVISDGRVGNI
jgi:hypothetical protein